MRFASSRSNPPSRGASARARQLAAQDRAQRVVATAGVEAALHDVACRPQQRCVLLDREGFYGPRES